MRIDRRQPGGRRFGRAAAAHPLTPTAAGLLLREPALGVAVPPRFMRSRHRIAAGQRFFHLEPTGPAGMLASARKPQAPRPAAPTRAWSVINLRKATYYRRVLPLRDGIADARDGDARRARRSRVASGADGRLQDDGRDPVPARAGCASCAKRARTSKTSPRSSAGWRLGSPAHCENAFAHGYCRRWPSWVRTNARGVRSRCRRAGRRRDHSRPADRSAGLRSARACPGYAWSPSSSAPTMPRIPPVCPRSTSPSPQAGRRNDDRGNTPAAAGVGSRAPGGPLAGRRAHASATRRSSRRSKRGDPLSARSARRCASRCMRWSKR